MWNLYYQCTYQTAVYFFDHSSILDNIMTIEARILLVQNLQQQINDV